MTTLPLRPSDETCPICGRYKISYVALNPILFAVNCQRCGQYNISGRLLKKVSETAPNHILSGITRNHWEASKCGFSIKCDNFESLDAFFKQSPIEIPDEANIPAKADLDLKHIRRESEFPGSSVNIDPEADFSLGFCKNSIEFKYLISYLESLKFIIVAPPDSFNDVTVNCQITPTGWAYLSGIGAEAKDQGFIAMAFCLPISDVLHTDGLNPGISNAGYNPMRIDRKDHNNRIDDEIVAEIRKSKFVVADLTGKNAGAYFEAGFAMGLGKPVIWTCKQSEIDAGNVHFDTRQYSIVSWGPDNLADFATRLTQRIEATIGHGRYVAEADKAK